MKTKKSIRLHNFTGTVRVNPNKQVEVKGVQIPKRKKKNPRKNVAAGFRDEEGVFHPIRASYDYEKSRVGEAPKKKAKKKAKKRK